MNPEAFARYVGVKDILQGGYPRQKVRVIGKFFSFSSLSASRDMERR
jgi:hypothetical protein